MKLSEVPEITIHDLKAKLDNNEDYILFDSRTEMDYMQAAIEGSILLTPENIAEELEYIEEDTPIYIICYRGNASKAVVIQLNEIGIKNLYSVAGGITAWHQAGYPLIKP